MMNANKMLTVIAGKLTKWKINNVKKTNVIKIIKNVTNNQKKKKTVIDVTRKIGQVK